MHPGDPHLVADYSQHGFPKTAAHFGLVGISAFLLELNLFFFVTDYVSALPIYVIVVADYVLFSY